MQENWQRQSARRRMDVCDKTVRKWAGRFSREGAAGLVDRSSRRCPHRLRCPTAPEVAEQVIALRRQRLLMKHIAAQLDLSIATVSRYSSGSDCRG